MQVSVLIFAGEVRARLAVFPPKRFQPSRMVVNASVPVTGHESRPTGVGLGVNFHYPKLAG
jgi:hypothetical protein